MRMRPYTCVLPFPSIRRRHCLASWCPAWPGLDLWEEGRFLRVPQQIGPRGLYPEGEGCGGGERHFFLRRRVPVNVLFRAPTLPREAQHVRQVNRKKQKKSKSSRWAAKTGSR